MSRTTHTPGKWRLMAGMPTNVLACGLRVARCDFDGDMENQEAQANARLIAAAPDLLEACKAASRALFDDPTKDIEEVAVSIGKAIAKAEGRAS